MEEKKNEQKAEQVVVIPVKEYRKLCRKIERLKIELKESEDMSNSRREWWQEAEKKNKELESKIADAKKAIEGYKSSAFDKLGLKDGGKDARQA